MLVFVLPHGIGLWSSGLERLESRVSGRFGVRMITDLQERVMGSYDDWTTRVVCVDIKDRLRRHVCRTCEAELLDNTPRNRRRVYCSKACDRVFNTEHFWGPARAHALRLARAGYLEEMGLRSRGAVQRYAYRCAHCGERTARPEVNHIDPVVGAPRSTTCKNHSENLEVLCHDCHVKVTNRQLSDRRTDVVLRPEGPAL